MLQFRAKAGRHQALLLTIGLGASAWAYGQTVTPTLCSARLDVGASGKPDRLNLSYGGERHSWVRTQGDGASAGLQRIPKGTLLFHWGNDEETKKVWPAQGNVNEAQLDYRLRGMGNAGGGVYVSRDPFDSTQYGKYLAVFEANQDLWVLATHDPDLMDRHGPASDCINRALSNAGVDGIYYSATWMNLLTLKALSKAKAGSADIFCHGSDLNDSSFVTEEMEGFLAFDQNQSLIACEGMKKRNPELYALLHGDTLSAKMKQKISMRLTKMVAVSKMIPLGLDIRRKTQLVTQLFKNFPDQMEVLAPQLAKDSAPGPSMH